MNNIASVLTPDLQSHFFLLEKKLCIFFFPLILVESAPRECIRLSWTDFNMKKYTTNWLNYSNLEKWCHLLVKMFVSSIFLPYSANILCLNHISRTGPSCDAINVLEMQMQVRPGRLMGQGCTASQSCVAAFCLGGAVTLWRLTLSVR